MNTDYRKEYNEYRERLWARKRELEEKISEIDSKQQDILHYLEFEKCDAITMMKLTKRLKTLREERRVIKNEWIELEPVCQRLNNMVSTRKQKKECAYSTGIITECLGITIQN